MSLSIELKPIVNDEDTFDSAYSVDDGNDENASDTDQFSRVKPKLLKTPSILNAIIDQLHPDIVAKSHQSNFVVFPPKLEGCTVVDLGCGVGRDVFILSKLVGEYGRVIGIDSENDQLNIARQYVDYHMKQFEYTKTNVEFVHAEIDHVEQTKIPTDSIDVVLSNSVINHRQNKRSIIEGVCKILKPGGEFYFSDIYTNQPIPNEYQELLVGECLSGALQWEDLILYATEAGFTQPRLVTAKPIILINEEIQKAIGKVKFVSAIFRCFKLPFTNVNDDDTYLSSLSIPYQLTYETPVPHFEDEFVFDHALHFRIGELSVVDDPSIAHALSLSRYKDNFLFESIESPSSPRITVAESVETSPVSSINCDNMEFYKKTGNITNVPVTSLDHD